MLSFSLPNLVAGLVASMVNGTGTPQVGLIFAIGSAGAWWPALSMGQGLLRHVGDLGRAGMGLGWQ